MSLNLEEIKKKVRNPRKLRLPDMKVFEVHCSGIHTMEVGDWGALSAINNASGGICLSAVAARTDAWGIGLICAVNACDSCAPLPITGLGV